MKLEIEIKKNMNVYEIVFPHGLSYYRMKEEIKEFSKLVKIAINEVYPEFKIRIEHIRNNTQIYVNSEFEIVLRFWIRSN